MLFTVPLKTPGKTERALTSFHWTDKGLTTWKFLGLDVKYPEEEGRKERAGGRYSEELPRRKMSRQENGSDYVVAGRTGCGEGKWVWGPTAGPGQISVPNHQEFSASETETTICSFQELPQITPTHKELREPLSSRRRSLNFIPILTRGLGR